MDGSASARISVTALVNPSKPAQNTIQSPLAVITPMMHRNDARPVIR